MSKVGKSEIRVDAFDKATGRTKYYEDTRRGEAVLRHVEAGQDLHHAGDRLRRSGIHRLHEAVSGICYDTI